MSLNLWIRVDAAAPRDPAICTLAEELGVQGSTALGLCVGVWCAMAEHAVDGHLGRASDRVIEQLAGWSGKRGRFADVFKSLFVKENGHVRGWTDRQGKLLDRMERDRERHRKPDGESPEPPRKLRGASAEIPGKSTSTERNGTEQKEKTVSRASRSTLKAPSEKQSDRIPAPVYDSAQRTWTEQVGAMEVPRFRKTVRTLLLAGIRLGQINRAIPRYARFMRERNRPLKLEWFAEDIQTWLKDDGIACEVMDPADLGLTPEQATEKARAHHAALAASDEEFVRRLTMEVVA